MTRKDFVLIAKVLAKCRPDDLQISKMEPEAVKWGNIVQEFTNELALTNDLFDPKRFKEACFNGFNDS